MSVVLYTSATCGYCVRAKRLLDSKSVVYQEISVDRDPAMRSKMVELSQRRTVPQIFIGEHHVGGCDDLFALEHSGDLDDMLRENNQSS